MDSLTAIIAQLKVQGCKITKAREAIINIFLNIRSPLSAGEILDNLKNIKINVNKTTVYRELDFLKDKTLVKELHIGDGKRRYELRDDTHHHHVICLKCDKIECVELPECIKKQEHMASMKSNYKIIEHSLKFYGICPNCL